MKTKATLKWMSFIVLALPIIALLAFLFSERSYLLGNTGLISAGEKYGIKIGSSLVTTKQILENNNFEESQYYMSGNDIGCLGFAETRTLDKIVYVDKSWRRGTVCIASDEGVVEYIAWRYSFFDP